MTDETLSRLLGAKIKVVDQRSLGGGCISEVSVVTIECDESTLSNRSSSESEDQGPTKIVVKRNMASMEHNFRCEADGLLALERAGAIRVPKVHAVEVVSGEAYLAMEFIASGGGNGNSFATFGQQLAQLHHATRGSRLGWERDSFLGSAPQPNVVCDSWSQFFAEQRIGFQIRWACEQGGADPQLRSDCEAIMDRMGELLAGREDQTSLIHGDLWSGNYLFDRAGQPVLIDPAVYYGCREAEWGMITWFGSCPPAFEDAYMAEWPMPDGWQRRVGVYRLYHQLNHLNLFGGSYSASCRHTAREILRCET